MVGCLLVHTTISIQDPFPLGPLEISTAALMDATLRVTGASLGCRQSGRDARISCCIPNAYTFHGKSALPTRAEQMVTEFGFRAQLRPLLWYKVDSMGLLANPFQAHRKPFSNKNPGLRLKPPHFRSITHNTKQTEKGTRTSSPLLLMTRI